MVSKKLFRADLLPLLLVLMVVTARAQSFRVQCPTSTITHPGAAISAISESGSTVTVTSSLNPVAGSAVNIVGVAPAQYNGLYLVTGTGAGSFTYTSLNTGLTSGLGGYAADSASNSAEPQYNGATTFTTNAQGFVTPTQGSVNGAIK